MKRPRKRFSPKKYAEIIQRQAGICGCGCGEELGADPRGFQFDHVISLEAGGDDTPENLCALKTRHHIAKSAREAGRRAKVKRIQQRDGLRQRRMNQGDKALARKLTDWQRPQ